MVQEENEAEKNLGVLIDNQLGFKSQVATETAKAGKVVGIIHKSIDNMAEELFVTLFKRLARPIPEYGHSVWTPRLTTLSQEVERVQRRATGCYGIFPLLRHTQLQFYRI